jgi:beta-lactamase superfamily II metal-dependent hydrolase
VSFSAIASEVDEIELAVLDVGHGSCVIARNGAASLMLDAGPGVAILQYFEDHGMTGVDTVVISHADKDHVRGVVALLDAGYRIGAIYCNPDALKKSQLWDALAFSLEDKSRRLETVVILDVGEGHRIDVGTERLALDILAPRMSLRVHGAGVYDSKGGFVSSNTMSVVGMFCLDNAPVMLVPGDMDKVAFGHLKESKISLAAPYLVLPHHGGLLGVDVVESASIVQELCDLVQPSTVFVSNGRGSYDNPRRQIVAAVRASSGSIKIACTQLSSVCSKAIVVPSWTVDGIRSVGSVKGFACAGTIRLSVHDGLTDVKDMAKHAAYVSEHVPAPLCLTLTERRV